MSFHDQNFGCFFALDDKTLQTISTIFYHEVVSFFFSCASRIFQIVISTTSRSAIDQEKRQRRILVRSFEFVKLRTFVNSKLSKWSHSAKQGYFPQAEIIIFSDLRRVFLFFHWWFRRIIVKRNIDIFSNHMFFFIWRRYINYLTMLLFMLMMISCQTINWRRRKRKRKNGGLELVRKMTSKFWFSTTCRKRCPSYTIQRVFGASTLRSLCQS